MIVTELYQPKTKRQLEESRILKSSTYKQFHSVGLMLAERKMTEKEILDVFAQAEADMTNKGTGANRTALGRGKDVVGKGITSAKDAISGVLNSIQNSAPVAGVDVAYDQATDALANLTGGEKSKIMDAVKKYRLLAKEYPKTQLFVKTALIALAGLATGGAGLPAIAGLTAAVDSAIKGEKLSSVIGKGAGAALMGLGAQKVNAMLQSTASGDEYDITDYNKDPVAPDANGLPGQFAGGQYEVVKGDQLGYIAQANGVSAEDIKALNPQINWAKPLQPGMTLNLPPQGDGAGSVWQGYTGGVYGDKAASAAGQAAGDTTSAATGSTPTAGDAATGAASNTATNATRSMAGPNDAAGADQFYNPETSGTAGMSSDDIAADLDYTNRVNAPAPAGYTKGIAYDEEGNLLPGWNAQNIGSKPYNVFKESIKFKAIPAAELFDSELTAAIKRLNESRGVRSKSVQLTYEGVYTVIENVDRYRKAILEAVGPGREQLPDYYRPDMPGAPQPQSAQPGMIGRGLNWLDKAAKKVGGAVSNLGHQFTTGVTKEKLKMNWHQAGKPTDSDELAAFLAQQKVPQEVITDVFGKMGIPYAAPAAEPAAQNAEPAAQSTDGYEQEIPLARINPATGKAYLPSEIPTYVEPASITKAKKDVDIERQEQEVAAELERERLKAQMQKGEREPGDWARARELSTRAIKPTDVSKNIQGWGNKLVGNKPGMKKLAKDITSATPSFAQGQQAWADPSSTEYVGRREAARRQASQPAAAPTAATPNYARQGGGYSSVNMNAPTGFKLPSAPTAPTVAKAPRVTSGGPTPAERAAFEKRVQQAAAQPVAETVKRVSAMLESVKTKKDIVKIRNYIDSALINENQQTFRTALHQKVTEVSAVKRRIAAKKAAK